MFGGELTVIWMLIGFLLAAYSVIANDSVQTLGTFIASNQKTKWYYLWGFTSLILIATLSISYFTSGGDIASGRLEKIPFVEIQWYHALAPLALVLLTRFGIPVSTSLLVLSAFASSIVFSSILTKSALGYGIAAVTAYVLWVIIFKWDNANNPVPENRRALWRVLQWSATGFLWYTWLSHDMANVAVFLPRELTLPQFLLVIFIFVAGLAYIFWNRGGKIQHIVLEKKNTRYIRSATIIDFVYALILIVFKEWNSIPMSTTWVFIGLLSGRELAMSTWIKDYKFSDVFPIVGKDVLRLLFGLAVSILIALLIQNREAIGVFFSGIF
ncbi:MAG: hypothetical protein H6779_00225 [Candidatus Nomurabacteria bacterium]|nr:MAG: hypothetical protein H6779_00225 [Candidatus Nomurabacteria bacterium]